MKIVDNIFILQTEKSLKSINNDRIQFRKDKNGQDLLDIQYDEMDRVLSLSDDKEELRVDLLHVLPVPPRTPHQLSKQHSTIET